MVSYNPFDEFFKFGLNLAVEGAAGPLRLPYRAHPIFPHFRTWVRQSSFQNSTMMMACYGLKVAEAVFNFRGLSGDNRKCELL